MHLNTESTVRTILADGKGILAADETPSTLTKRSTGLSRSRTTRDSGTTPRIRK